MGMRGAVLGTVVGVTAAVVATGCGSAVTGNGNGESVAVSNANGSLSLATPSGWQRPSEALRDPVVYAATKADDPQAQIIVNVLKGGGAAEQEAIWNSTGLSTASTPSATCQRLDEIRAFGWGRLGFDCVYEAAGIHKYFIPIAHGDQSALILIQLPASAIESSGPAIGSFLDSITWR